ncbi:MAG: tetratricopeptide repeat protein [Bacteroidetes bacterium]|nr:tetratricopeptide repeat protein [Bacteroidota bacterium]
MEQQGKFSIHKLYKQIFNEELTPRNLMIYGIFIIVLITGLVYSNAVQNGFVNYDDHVYVVENQFIKDVNADNVKVWFTNQFNGHYHPLTVASWALQYQAFGMNPKAFHVFSLLLHLINVVLVFLLIQKLFNKTAISFIVTFGFALHPMNVESIAWVSGQGGLLYSMFFLITLLLYLQYITSQSKLKWYLIAFGVFVLACLSKSMAVTLPVLLLVIDYAMKRKFNWQVWVEKIPFLVVSLLFGIMALKSAEAFGSFEFRTQAPGLGETLITSVYGLFLYIVKFVVPVSLCAIYPTQASIPAVYYVAPVILVVLAIVLYRIKQLRREIITGVLFFLVTIGIVLKTAGTTVIAERYVYVPYIGLLIVIAAILVAISERKFPKVTLSKAAVNGILLLYLLFFCVAAADRNKVWSSDRALFQDMANKRSSHYFGWVKLADMEATYGDIRLADSLYTMAISKDTGFADLYQNRAKNREKLGLFPQAMADYNKAIQLKPSHYWALVSRGLMSARINKDFVGAFDDFNHAVEIAPHLPDAFINRANVYVETGEYSKAITDLENVLKEHPQRVEVYFNLANIKFLLNDYEGAYSDVNRFIEVNNTSPDALLLRGSCLFELGRDYDKVHSDWLVAFQLGSQKAYMKLKKYFDANGKLIENAIVHENKDSLNNLTIGNSETLTENLVSGKNKLKLVDDASSGKKILKLYDDEGRLMEETSVNDLGNPDGEFKRYFPSGLVKIKGFYTDSIPSGKWEEYYANGNVMAAYSYISGLMDGSYMYYFENGQLWTERTYKAGKLWDVVANFDSKGNFKEKGTLKDGTGVLFTYDENGNLSGKLEYKNGIRIK